VKQTDLVCTGMMRLNYSSLHAGCNNVKKAIVKMTEKTMELCSVRVRQLRHWQAMSPVAISRHKGVNILTGMYLVSRVPKVKPG